MPIAVGIMVDGEYIFSPWTLFSSLQVCQSGSSNKTTKLKSNGNFLQTEHIVNVTQFLNISFTSISTHTQTHTLGYSEYTPHSMRSSYYHNSHANRWNKFINSSHHTLARALIHLYCTQYTLANTLVRQARTNTHLRLMTMDIMYETVQNKAHTVYSLFAVFCCFFFSFFSIWHFIWLSFLIIIMVFFSQCRYIVYNLFQLNFLCCFFYTLFSMVYVFNCFNAFSATIFSFFCTLSLISIEDNFELFLIK